MQHHRVHAVVIAFLMRIRFQITVFIQYNECQGICLASTDAMTYRQLCTSASTFILIQGEDVQFDYKTSTSHLAVTSSVLLH